MTSDLHGSQLCRKAGTQKVLKRQKFPQGTVFAPQGLPAFVLPKLKSGLIQLTGLFMSFCCVGRRTLLLMAALFSSLGHAQSAPVKSAGNVAQAAPAIQQQAPTTNGITQAAVQQGVLNCASRINQVTNFLGFTPQAGAVLMTPPNAQDQRLIPLAMEIPTEGGSAYVSVQFAPNQANGCGATYDAVVFWPQKCDAVAGKQFAVLKKVGQMKKDITVLDGGLATKVFLMPAGSGCVSIKKEVVL